MMEFLTAVGAGIFALLGLIAWKLFQRQAPADTRELQEENARLKAEMEQKAIENGTLRSTVETERSEKNELQGKGKQLAAEHMKLEARHESLAKELDAVRKHVAGYEAQEQQNKEEMQRKLSQLERAEQALKEERQRVIQDDEERRKQMEEERDRLWAEHELSVVSLLTDLCKHPSLGFTSFTNTSLPEGFDGSLKPDFMIEFLGQYVIFDAKVSKAKSLKVYIDDQVKKTVGKVKDNKQIHPWLFLVVPTSAISELKSHHYVVDGYHLYVISPEALPAILASLKRITMYEFAEQMDPQQRENIVQVIADFDFHINLRNAADIFLSSLGADILERAQKLDPALAEEVTLKKQPMNAKAVIAASEIKRLVANVSHQKEEIQRLASPRTRIRQKDIESAASLLSETLS